MFGLSRVSQASQNHPHPARLLAAIEACSLACGVLATSATLFMRSLSCTYVYVWAVLALLLPILVLVLRRAMTAPESAPEFPVKSPVRTANRRNSYFDDPRVLGPAVRPVPLHWRDSPARFSRGMASLLRSSKKAVEPMGYARGRDLRTSLAPVGASSQQSLDRISLVVETLLARDGERRRSRGASGRVEETSFAEETSRPGFAAGGLSKRTKLVQFPVGAQASSNSDVAKTVPAGAPAGSDMAKPVPVGAQGKSKFVAEPLGDDASHVAISAPAGSPSHKRMTY